MQPKSSQSWPIAAAIVISAVLICATLVVLNVRQTYAITDPNVRGTQYLKLLQSGCVSIPLEGGGIAGVSCPLWIRP